MSAALAANSGSVLWHQDFRPDRSIFCARRNRRYPLAEWEWTREDCEQVILTEGLPLPVKSACWMCPASKRSEVDWLAITHPDLAGAAIEVERRAHARPLATSQGLGRRWSWTEHLGYGDPRHPQQKSLERVPAAGL